MPTLLRLAIAAITFVVVNLGAVVLALAEAPSSTLLAGAFALAFLTLPPLLAGAFVSYWAWESEARRRLRVWLIVLGVVQLVALIGLVLVLVGLPGAELGGAFVIVIALLQDPAAILLGRAARRRERPIVGTGDTEVFHLAVRRTWRRSGIGAILGFAAGTVLALLLSAVFAEPRFDWTFVSLLPMCVAFGASVGLLTGYLGLAGRVRELLGPDYSSARRIGRAVSGKPEALTEDEEARAARYAAVAPDWLRLQGASQLLNAAISLVVLLGIVLRDDDARWFFLAVAVISAASVVLVAVLLGRQSRRVRAYAAAHPVPTS